MTPAERTALEDRIRRLGLTVKPGAFRDPAPVARRATARPDRFLSRREIETIVELAKAQPVKDIARLLQTSGELDRPCGDFLLDPALVEWREDAARRGYLVRPGIGRVLGVR